MRKRRRMYQSSRRKKNQYSLFLFWAASLIWMELVFHLVSFTGIKWQILWPVFLVIPIAGVFSMLCALAKSRKVNLWITGILQFFSAACFGVNLVYHGIFKTYLGIFSSIAQGNAANALGFWPFLQLGLKTMVKNWWVILLLLVPLIFLVTIGKNLIAFRRMSLRRGVIIGGIVLGTYLLSLIGIRLGGKDPYSIYDLYYHNSSLSAEVENLGIMTSMRLDLMNVLKNAFFPSLSNKDSELGDVVVEGGEDWRGEEKPSDASGDGIEETREEETEAPKPVDLHDLYQFMDIDFESLIASADSDTVKTMHEYFSVQTPTAKNEYTGKYAGYNLIFLTAEGFSPYAVDEEITPTLYKLVNTGYVFKNFYTPLWYGSTSAGEYVNVMSQYPKDGGYISMQESGVRGTDMYHSLGRYMERAGYNLWGFHNNSYTYYGRDLSMPNMGYSRWIATRSGYDPELNKYGNAYWPQSDQRLIEQSFPMYSSEEPFHVYYMTVSGHVEYTFSGNAMAQRNREAVDHLPLSNTAKAYLACNIELDHALRDLIAMLEEKGLADRTLIVLSADHIPYNNEEMCDEIAAYQKSKAGEDVGAGYQLERNFEKYRNNLIIWTGSMEEGENVIIDKPCYSIDILPTVLNLLGIDYESRVLMGKDIFSEEDGLVVFPNRSWITDKAMYNASTKEVTNLTNEELPEDYASQISRIVRDKLKISRQLVDVDYYSYLH